MRRSSVPGVVVLAAVVILAAAAMPVAAHVNHVSADPQRTADGTLTLEWEFVGTDGWVVVRADDDGDPGAVLGHRRATTEEAFRTDTTVRVDDAAWAEWGDSRTVWVVLHQENGGEGFALEDDPMQTGITGDPAGSRITVATADGATSVTAQGFQPETVRDGTVTIRRVELDAPGYVAVQTLDAEVAATARDGDVGAPVGATALDAGVHDNVTVQLSDAYLANASSEALLTAVLYTGTGGFDANTSTPVTAGDALVRTAFGVEFRGDAVDGPTPTPTTDSGALVTTPASASPTGTPSGAGAATGDGTGLGPVVAVLALAGAVAVARRHG